MWTLYIGTVCVIALIHWVYKWRNPQCNGKLPPGSMGFPILGETLQFFTPYSTNDLSPFVKERVKRYGPIFKTNLVGRPLILSTDSDLNNFVFQQEGNLFQPWYPESFMEILGQDNLFSLRGFMHKHLKNMVLNLLGPVSLQKMFPDLEEAAVKTLKQWSCQDTIEVFDETKSMIFDLSARKLISYDSAKSPENLRSNFSAFIQGLISFPLNIPGTAYSKCIQGRKNAMRMLKALLHERRLNPRKEQSDYFDYVIEELNKEDTILTEKMALDLMFGLLFASHEATSMAIALAMKFLHDHPLVLQRLTEEHESILRQRKETDSGFTWSEYKSMTYTFQFINETIRLGNIVPVIYRKALKEIQFKGYTIPKGWCILVFPPAVHLDQLIYDNPLSFNPSRWEGVKVSGKSKEFIAFGGGARLCSGADFAKVQMAVFLHCLVTKYRWENIRGDNVLRVPGIQFPGGFHIRVREKDVQKAGGSTSH